MNERERQRSVRFDDRMRYSNRLNIDAEFNNDEKHRKQAAADSATPKQAVDVDIFPKIFLAEFFSGSFLFTLFFAAVLIIGLLFSPGTWSSWHGFLTCFGTIGLIVLMRGMFVAAKLKQDFFTTDADEKS